MTAALALAGAATTAIVIQASAVADAGRQAAPARPALTVSATTPESADWPRVLTANGSVVAWQEASIGAEISNFRLTEVLVDVGDQVKRGQLLARIASETVAAELAQARAAVSEAQAMLAEARANAERARQLQTAGFYSAQQTTQALTAEEAARARLEAAQAMQQTQALRLAQTQVRAPDAGVISARNATVGSLVQPGQELFRLIRANRLEWRAEVTEAELGLLKPGLVATLRTPSGRQVQGRLRALAPTVDPRTRNALVYVDLPASATASGVRAGMFAQGTFQLGQSTALTLPQAAVLLRDGFAYVFRLTGDEKSGHRVIQTKVRLGRRIGERIEILAGIHPGTRVVAAGAGFLADGDSVRVVATPTGKPARP